MFETLLKGIPYVAGFALASILVPLDGGASALKVGTSSAIALGKFALVGAVGYGATKAIMTPEVECMIAEAARRAADETMDTYQSFLRKKEAAVEVV